MRSFFMGLLLLSPLTQDDRIEALIKQLGAGSFEEQGKAAAALEEIGPAALPALDKAAKSDNEQVRDWAAKIRGRIEENGRKIRAIIEELGSESFEKQGRAADELKKIGAKARPWLEEARKSENKQIREWVAKILPEKKSSTDEMGTGGGKYGGRVGGHENLVARGGGTRATESAVLAALKWLARHQSEDGSWGAVGFRDRCKEDKCAGIGVRDFDTGVTGLALLAFLGAGYSHLSKDTYDEICFGTVVKNGLKWLMSQQDREGCVGERGPKYMYNHAICAIALCEAYGLTGSALFKDAAQKAVDFLVSAQNPGKGWRYSSKSGDNDTSVTGWAVQALKSAEMSDLKFPKSGYEGAIAWFREVTDDQYYRSGYTTKGTGKVFVPGKNEDFEDHPAMSAAAVVSRIFINKNKREPALGAAHLLVNDLPEWKAKKIDFYYWYYATMALFQYDGPDGPMWKKWNEPMTNALIPNQRFKQDGCANGSWDSEVDRWGFEGGRVYSTAINALTLEIYYRYPVVAKK